MLSLCNHWEFTPVWTDEYMMSFGAGEVVRLPHNVKELPMHYIDHNSYQMVCGYRRKLEITDDLLNNRLFVQFDGAAHIATVYVNGKELAHHRCGYTSFRVEITDSVILGENIIAVKLDTTENPMIPPFGFVIDYLTYGGLYREVWLDVRNQSLVSDVYITTPTTESAHIEITAENTEGCSYQIEIRDEEGNILLNKRTYDTVLDLPMRGVRKWRIDDPYRYLCSVSLIKDEIVIDKKAVKFGFRTAEFKENQFYLNGEPVFLRGLNRHQCWPYIGYAAPESMQREDARILKEELGCIITRTSHYPQSHHFIDECDRLGLLVFTEIPGWQHIGESENWRQQCIENTKEMLLQYRNHPSIVVWGVRINESPDCDELYRITNDVAHKLDPSRATTGVRCTEKSNLIDDVYSYNDFSHAGDNPGVKTKKSVTSNMGKSLMITEHNGHMFPTKAFDPWQIRQEHALRHARVLNDAVADAEHAGCIGWCMFDYATHKDFGSGDRICYHGVMDAFRNPKLAAYFYASQQDQTPVLAVGSHMHIGDYSGGQIGEVSVFTNADTVKLYKNGRFVSNLAKGDWKGLSHGPMVVDDTIGELLETQEGFEKQKADLLKKALLSAGKYGMANLPKVDWMRFGYAMVRYKMSFDEGANLYKKYIGNWGGEATVWRFDAIKNGEIVSSVTCCPSAKLHLEAFPSITVLTEGATYDMASIRIRVVDEFGNIAPYAQLPIKVNVEGAAELVSPNVVVSEGGMCGAFIRTTGETGKARMVISSEAMEPVVLEFSVE